LPGAAVGKKPGEAETDKLPFVLPVASAVQNAKAAELLGEKWALVSTNDNDPASPPATHADYSQRQITYAAVTQRLIRARSLTP